MLIKSEVLRAIGEGRIDCDFRRWRRASVRSGSTLHTQLGLLRIASAEIVQPEDITEAEARAAGYPDLLALHADLDGRSGETWRIVFAGLDPDPRIELGETIASDERELARLQAALARLHPEGIGHSLRLLRLIQGHPGRRAEELAQLAGSEKARFKREVQRLKALGLTRSLKVGYEVSPRGEAVLDGLTRLSDET